MEDAIFIKKNDIRQKNICKIIFQKNIKFYHILLYIFFKIVYNNI